MIDAKRVTGPGAGVVKYDILTALGIIGMNGRQPGEVSMLRLISAVTARYNWRSDEMVVGQRDLAFLWNVAERTAKREIKRLTGERLLLVKRPGVRGRVASYHLNMAEIAARSRLHWETVGPDFAERMATHVPDEAKIVRLDFSLQDREEPAGRRGTWRAVRARLRSGDPAVFANWYDHLMFLGHDAGEVRLRAVTPFVGRYVEMHLAHALSAAIEAEMGSFDRLRIESTV